MKWLIVIAALLLLSLYGNDVVLGILATVIIACIFVILRILKKQKQQKAEDLNQAQAQLAAEREAFEREREAWQREKEAKVYRESSTEKLLTALPSQFTPEAASPQEQHQNVKRNWYELDEETSRRINEEVVARKKQFSDEVEAIPRVAAKVSAPALKQYLKDMPEYGFSNITAKTKLKSIFPLVVLDVETTGLYPSDCEIIEVSAIKFKKGMIPVECFTTLCKPKKPIPPQATAINHITDEMVVDCPNFRQIAPAFSEFIADCNLAGHNLEFDLRFLHVHGTKIPFEKKLYDTLEIAQRTVKRSEIGNHKLESLCSWYGIYQTNAHRSLSDCYATAKILNYLVFDKTSRDLEKETGE